MQKYRLNKILLDLLEHEYYSYFVVPNKSRRCNY